MGDSGAPRTGLKSEIMEEKPSNSEGYSREDWQRHYETDDLRWDIGEASPPFVRLWDERRLQPGDAIIPGCGRGHEAVFFAERGFNVTAVDIAPGAAHCLRRILNEKRLPVNVVLGDFFELGPAHDNRYDVMFEQTFFCAIAPSRRDRYVETAFRILKPNGILTALFYETGEPGGPPFNTSREDVLRHFAIRFDIERLEKTPHSVERRKGKEWLGILRRK